MTVTPSDFSFEKTARGGRWYKVMPNGEEAKITYVDVAPGHIIADHTFVPVPYRGDGVAEALVERLIAEARAAGNKITPACWYVADEFKRHAPEWDDLLRR